MMFTGKAKSNFEDYYQHFKLTKQYNLPTLEDFYKLPDAMQWGVYQDWADSMGYSLEIKQGQRDYTVVIYQPEVDEEDCVYGIKTRDEARKSAIKAFDEIVNRDTSDNL